MVTGAVVTAALCDQIRDNLVALHDGWWFRATMAAGFTLSTAAPFELSTITVSQTATDEGSIFLSGGDVVVRKPGIWHVGCHFTCTGTTTTIAVAVDCSDGTGYVCQNVWDAGNTKNDFACSGAIEVTSVPATFQLVASSSGSTTVSINSRSPFLWGCWMGTSP
jgi:hypothetical protein